MKNNITIKLDKQPYSTELVGEYIDSRDRLFKYVKKFLKTDENGYLYHTQYNLDEALKTKKLIEKLLECLYRWEGAIESEEET